MGGPHRPEHPDGTGGPVPYPGAVGFPHDPGQMPPTGYPKRRSRRPLIIGILLAGALLTAMTVLSVHGVRTHGATSGPTFEASAKTAIQKYVDALEHGDTDTIVRNALCGMYDVIRDKRSDQALAKLNSDAFRKQFSEIQLTSVDKVVYLSQYQAQALFTMRVSPVAGGPAHRDVQGLAQLLLLQRGQTPETLVCSYVLRTGGTY